MFVQITLDQVTSSVDTSNGLDAIAMVFGALALVTLVLYHIARSVERTRPKSLLIAIPMIIFACVAVTYAAASLSRELEIVADKQSVIAVAVESDLGRTVESVDMIPIEPGRTKVVELVGGDKADLAIDSDGVIRLLPHAPNEQG